MSTNTQIEWATKTWGPVIGCTQVSPGCAHCYALVMHNRRHKAYLAGKLQNMPQYARPFSEVQLLDDRLLDPLSWSKPQLVFVNSQSDLFHDDIPDEYIARVFAVTAVARRHTFQVLTKRPARMRALLNDPDFAVAMVKRIQELQHSPDVSWLEWPLSNVWLGVSAENQRWADERIPLLLQTPAAVRFLSCEPLLGPLDIRPYLTTLAGVLCCPRCGFRTNRFSLCPNDGAELVRDISVDWVIAGAELGTGARPMEIDWVRSLRDQCDSAGVSFMFKQDATPNGRKISLPVLDGRQWTEMPELAHA